MQHRFKMALPLIMLLIFFCVLKAYILASSMFGFMDGDSNIEVYSSIISNAQAVNQSSEKTEHTTLDERVFVKQSQDATSLTNHTIDEVQILQSLYNRRRSLEVKEAEFATKDKILEATERTVGNKIRELNQLQVKVNNMLKHYEDREKVQIKSLVRIYENMQPKDAAKIFNDLETKMLVTLISHMKELKVSPILANMSSPRAREVSIALANSSQLNH